MDEEVRLWVTENKTWRDIYDVIKSLSVKFMSEVRIIFSFERMRELLQVKGFSLGNKMVVENLSRAVVRSEKLILGDLNRFLVREAIYQQHE